MAMMPKTIFDDRSTDTLLSIGLEPKLAWSLKSARAVIIRKLDDDILNSSYVEIADELLEHTPWMQLSELWKNFHTLKITLRTINIAQRCIHCGISLFYLHIPKFNIEREVQINVHICDYCFAYEHHRSANCPKRAEKPIVSNLLSLCC